ncbi:hypothetical protein R3P38DRAFT_2780845 [Favolaschia claudopus]|uniref:Uncharacterized protein n=1 Tax=Favolaschia claudopus TaxID=2862362 RepID=A0AAW0B6D2_9AGAR
MTHDPKYAYLKANAAMRFTSGSRVKKAKVHLEARLEKRAPSRRWRMRRRPAARKKSRRMGTNTREGREFVQGLSRDVYQGAPVGNEDDAHPTIDLDYDPRQDRDFYDSGDEENADPQANESESD